MQIKILASNLCNNIKIHKSTQLRMKCAKIHFSTKHGRTRATTFDDKSNSLRSELLPVAVFEDAPTPEEGARHTEGQGDSTRSLTLADRQLALVEETRERRRRLASRDAHRARPVGSGVPNCQNEYSH